ncbi:MAG: twitch domain-containing radical SAM protein [Oligoflexia bacterium]|nr:twitch domain-containing radical SAM protein [Oligoflexia bacterium]
MSKCPENLCVIPFVHLTSKPNGAVRLCCFSTKYIKDQSGNQLFFGRDSLEQIWNSHDMRGVRMKMLNNEKLTECRYCWDEEANGKTSKRMRENKRFLKSYERHLESAQNNKGYISEYPSYLDLRLGNKCNLKCRTCNPLFSSAWLKEIERNKANMTKNSFIQNLYQSDFNRSRDRTDWYETETFFNTVKKISKDLRLVYISGGEPLLIKSQHLFIDHFLKTGAYKKIVINMNTNLTYLDKSLLEKLARFKRANFSVSIDAYGAKNNWIRSPSRFAKIEKNMERVINLSGNVNVSINCTVSVYNILYLSELIDWSRNIAKRWNKNIPIVHFDLLHHPFFQQISILPFSLKEKAMDRLNQIKERVQLFPTEIKDMNSLIKILQSSFEENKKIQELRSQLKEHTKIFDRWRKEDFFSVFPEFIGHL